MMEGRDRFMDIPSASTPSTYINKLYLVLLFVLGPGPTDI